MCMYLEQVYAIPSAPQRRTSSYSQIIVERHRPPSVCSLSTPGTPTSPDSGDGFYATVNLLQPSHETSSDDIEDVEQLLAPERVVRIHRLASGSFGGEVKHFGRTDYAVLVWRLFKSTSPFVPQMIRGLIYYWNTRVTKENIARCQGFSIHKMRRKISRDGISNLFSFLKHALHFKWNASFFRSIFVIGWKILDPTPRCSADIYRRPGKNKIQPQLSD